MATQHTRQQDYHYTACGLDTVWLKGVTIHIDEDGDEVVTIPSVNVLHRTIARDIIRSESGLKPKELRFLRTLMGLTQAQLAELLKKDVQSLGRWERGEHPIDPTAEVLVRVMTEQFLGSKEPTDIACFAQWSTATAAPKDYRIDVRTLEEAA
jgi:DNA-binding transcriptional regulator YiaG